MPVQRMRVSPGSGRAKRLLWAIKHQQGISLVQATTSVRAVRAATKLIGSHAAPFHVLRNQPQEIAIALAQGTKILNQTDEGRDEPMKGKG